MTGVLTLVSCRTNVGLTLTLRRQLAMTFSNNPQVIAAAAAAMPILAASLLGDGVTCAC
jgi:Na+-driven multidrug efflux pump